MSESSFNRNAPSNNLDYHSSYSANYLAFFVAVIALAGSLWLSIGMGLKACPLCFYQRTFVMAVVAVIGFGSWTRCCRPEALNLLAYPMAVGGFLVALYHTYLEAAGKLECPSGILGIGTAPQQSLTILSILLVVMSLGLWRDLSKLQIRQSPWVALGLGIGLAIASIVSAPPLPARPTEAYKTPLDICRPPFVTARADL